MNLSRFLTRHKQTIVLLVVLLLMFGPALAMAAGSGGAGSAGGAFNDLYDSIKELLAGSLGKLLTILALAVALVVAVKVGSIIGVLGAFAIALAAVYGPDVLEAFFTATLPVADFVQNTAPILTSMLV